MKRFTEYLNEDFDPAIYNSDGAISINDPTVVDALNANLDASTSSSFRTPYNALEEVRKVLAYYKIFLPKSIFLDQNHGNDVFEISQFGEKMGMNNDGEVVAASDSSLFLYFEWSMDEKGMYDVFASIVNSEELEEIMADFDAEVEDDESELNESIAEKTKMLYKLVNKMNTEKQMNEMPMPDLKKKMDAKKASLPNMMKEDDMDKFDDDDKPKKPKKAMKYRHETSGKEIMHTGTPPKGYKIVKESEQLDEVSRKKATSAYAAANDPGYYHPKAEKILKHIERKFGSKAADDAETHAYTSHFGRGTPKKGKDSLSGGLRQYASDKLTKSGKIPKNTQTAMKNRMDPKKWQGHGRKVGGPKKKLPEETQLNELSKKTLGDYIKKASHDVATKSAATGRYADRANKARDEMKKGDYKNWPQGKKDDEFADKMFKKSWKRRKGIAKAVDKITK